MATLKEGIEIRPNGPLTLLTGEIEDDVAQHLLDSDKAKKTDFSKLPSKKAAAEKEQLKEQETEEDNPENKK